MLKNQVRSVRPPSTPRYLTQSRYYRCSLFPFFYFFTLEQAAGKKAAKESSKDDANEGNDEEDSDSDDDDALGPNTDENDESQVSFPFAIPAILIDLRSRHRSNSLNMYLNIMSRSNSLNNSDRTNMKSLVPLRDFKKDYHSYCFNQRMIPRNLKSNLRELDAFGLSIKTLYDHRTDAFIKIRLASQKENRKEKT